MCFWLALAAEDPVSIEVRAKICQRRNDVSAQEPTPFLKSESVLHVFHHRVCVHLSPCRSAASLAVQCIHLGDAGTDVSPEPFTLLRT